jgi:signal transduction histidine kinase/CheY-like chemotaxis protein
MNKLEQLREALASAKQLAAAQEDRLRQQELVLSGIQAITIEQEPEVALERAFELLRSALVFDRAMVLEPSEDEFVCLASTDPARIGDRWPAGAFFRRVAGGRGGVTPDVSRVPEWQVCGGEAPERVGALFTPISTGLGAGLMILVADHHGAYSATDLALVSRMGLLVSQTLAKRQQRRLAEAVRRSEFEREAAVNANEVKSRFFANMSHEIRTPLNGVVAVAELLSRTDLGERQQEMVDLILDSGRMLERLLNDVLDFAKMESGHLALETSAFRPASELKSVFELFAARADEKGLALEVTQDEAAQAWIEADSLRVRQVVSNLLSNAVKFTHEGGVYVDIRVEPADERVRIRIRVRDTGCGFPKETAERLFDRFEQADGSITRRFGGTGLGLPIARTLARMMDGDIVCTATPGDGATFDFWFEADPAQPQQADAARAEPAELPPTLRVLVVDDNANNQRIAGMILEMAGVTASFAGDGQAACDAVAVARFDVVLMDLQMPVMDGLTAIRRIRAVERELGAERLPIIAVSANAMIHQVSEALAAGADAHVAKPIDPGALLCAIGEVCAPHAQPARAAV